MDLVQFVVVVSGVVFTVYQVSDISEQSLNRKNELSLNYYDRLTTGINKKITSSIGDNSSIKNKFSTDEIDGYLNIFNDIGDRLNKGLLDSNIVCNDFYDITTNVYENIEIQDYLKVYRKNEPAYFAGFDDLYFFIKNSCK
jgi:hypothetical protein